jgi:hypothetical protein
MFLDTRKQPKQATQKPILINVIQKGNFTSPEYNSSTCIWLGDKTPISSA